MMVGKLGRSGCGVNPLRGQNNVQGGCDMGAQPNDFPGYQKITIDGKPYELCEGESIVMPAGHPHAVFGKERFKMLLVVVK